METVRGTGICTMRVQKKHGGVTHHIEKGIAKEYRGRKSVLTIANDKRPRTSPLFDAHTEQRVFSLENKEIVFWV